MCTAQAAVTSKWWLVLNVLRPSKCFISTLVEGTRRELKENTWRPFSMARTGQPPGLCVFVFLGITRGRRTNWVRCTFFRRPVVGEGISVAVATSPLLPKQSVSQKHFPETRGWPLHQSRSVCPPACVVLVNGCFSHCWGCTICCQTGRTAPELFAVVIVVN